MSKDEPPEERDRYGGSAGAGGSDDARLDVSRRRLLGGVASAGIVGALVGAGTQARIIDTETFGNNDVRSGTGDLRVGWTVTRDESLPDPPCDDLRNTTDPVVRLEELDAGDGGALSVCLDWTDGPAELWTRLRVVASDENGLGDAEEDAGDDADDGELASALEVTAWEDPECTGDRTTLAEGSMVDVSQALRSGVRVGSSETTRACFGVEWTLPEGADVTVRTDQVAFAVDFAAEQSRHNDGSDNPWGET